MYNDNYSPTELMNLCKVESESDNAANVSKILSIITDPHLKPEEKPEHIQRIVDDACAVSIGQSLRRLSSIADLPDELEACCA